MKRKTYNNKEKERKDKERVAYAGAVVIQHYDWIVGTGMSLNEDYKYDLAILTNSGTTKQIEIKTLTKKYNIDEQYQHWHCDKPENDWGVINKETKDKQYENSKWHKLMNGVYQGLIYIKRDGLYLYDIRNLKGAYLGDMHWQMKHTTEFEDDSRSWELKAVVDLSKAKKIECTPPNKLFVTNRSK